MYRKNVASQNLAFALVNASTGAALTGATVTARRSIDGGAQASATGSVSELGNGQYNLALSQADTNGNHIGILLTATNAIPVHFSLVMTAADPTDSVRLGLTALPNAAAGASAGLPVLLHAGTAQAGAAQTITLAAAASAVDRLYTLEHISIVGGTGAGQVRTIVDYNGASKVATVNRAWRTNPDNTSVYQLTGAETLALPVYQSGTAQAGGASTIQLSTAAATVDDAYSGLTIHVTGGTGAAQTRVITDFVGATRTATVDRAWDTAPDNTSVYLIVASNSLATNGAGGLAALATDVITSGAVAASAVTEIQTGLATQASVDTIDDFLDTEIAAILADTNELQTDWANGGRLDNILDARASQTSVDDLPTNAELTTALAAADDAVLTAVAGVQTTVDDIPTNAELATALASADDAVLSAVAGVQTSVDDLPTNAELATALGTADDAVLAAVGALNDLDATEVQAAAAAALAAYDGPTNAELTTALADLPTNAELATALASADDAILAAINALENLSAAEVNAEVVDALSVDSYTELSAVPSAATNLANMLRAVYAYTTNRVTETATTQTLRNRANSATIATHSVSDDGSTYVRGSAT